MNTCKCKEVRKMVYKGGVSYMCIRCFNFVEALPNPKKHKIVP